MRRNRYFLGISGGVLIGNHDAAAALIRDGELVAAAEEERFIRIKHAFGRLPEQAIRYCLKQENITLKNIECISFPGKTYYNFSQILKNFFDLRFGYIPSIKLINHHLAHSAASYYSWKNEPAIILIMDYSGDNISTSASIGYNGKIKNIFKIMKPNSLGLFYSMITQYLGFEKDEDEYKIMGLSSYGNCNSLSFKNIISKKDDIYSINLDYINNNIKKGMPSPSIQQRIYKDILRLKEMRRLPDEKIKKYHFDIAASAQKTLEDIVLHIIDNLVKKTGIRNICLGGGVALNCLLNQKIRESGLIDQIFLPPHTSDAGLSIGCAYLLCIENGIILKPFEHCFIGPEYKDKDILTIIKNCNIAYSKPYNIQNQVAKDLVKGKIIGWFQGKMEFGPRALGNRSIIADCRNNEIKDKINKYIKYRESFRPFAPSVLEEKADEYFDNVIKSPYMTMTFNVREDKKSLLKAVTHVDGTARIQTVDKKTNYKFYNLINQFYKLTGIPVILNTSLNIKGQPIACTPRDAIEIFFSTGLDSLALGSYYLSK